MPCDALLPLLMLKHHPAPSARMRRRKKFPPPGTAKTHTHAIECNFFHKLSFSLKCNQSMTRATKVDTLVFACGPISVNRLHTRGPILPVQTAATNTRVTWILTSGHSHLSFPHTESTRLDNWVKFTLSLSQTTSCVHWVTALLPLAQKSYACRGLQLRQQEPLNSCPCHQVNCRDSNFKWSEKERERTRSPREFIISLLPNEPCTLDSSLFVCLSTSNALYNKCKACSMPLASVSMTQRARERDPWCTSDR